MIAKELLIEFAINMRSKDSIKDRIHLLKAESKSNLTSIFIK